MSDYIVVIPARYASTRLPGKPLLDIGGKPMIVRVAEQAAKSAARQVWIATDHHGVANTVVAHGFDSVMTSEQHASGTDRIAEVVRHLQLSDDTIVVNVQGDEPLIDPAYMARPTCRRAPGATRPRPRTPRRRTRRSARPA